jgi:hypothetical protein
MLSYHLCVQCLQDGKEAGHGAYWATARWVGDGFFTCPARQTAASFSQASGSYQYFFNHTIELLDETGALFPTYLGQYFTSLGVFHASELVFVYDFHVVSKFYTTSCRFLFFLPVAFFFLLLTLQVIVSSLFVNNTYTHVTIGVDHF